MIGIRHWCYCFKFIHSLAIATHAGNIVAITLGINNHPHRSGKARLQMRLASSRTLTTLSPWPESDLYAGEESVDMRFFFIITRRTFQDVEDVNFIETLRGMPSSLAHPMYELKS